MFRILASISLTFVLFSLVTCKECKPSSFKNEAYVSSDRVTDETTVIVEFSADCGQPDGQFHAALNDDIVTATKMVDNNKYQVSWTFKPKALENGEHIINFYDDEGYTELRKAQRSGEGVEKVQEKFKVTIRHMAISHTRWFQSELFTACAAGLLFYSAHTLRNRIQQ